MLPRLFALACLSVVALVGLKVTGAASAWWPSLPAGASLGLIIVAWVTGAWLLLARLAPQPATLVAPAAPVPVVVHPGHDAPATTPTSRLSRRERRAHQRFTVDWPVRAEWREGSVTEGRLQDISHGGACIAAAGPVPKGTDGLLRVDGIVLPVPARVVDWTPATGLHVAFQLQGLGLETFLVQLHRQLERGNAASHG